MKLLISYSRGVLLTGQCAKRGRLKKKLDLKGSIFKPSRGLELTAEWNLLPQVNSKELSINDEGIKDLKEVQKAFTNE